MFEKIKKFYDKGLYTKKQVKDFFDKGMLTKEEYHTIIGE